MRLVNRWTDPAYRDALRETQDRMIHEMLALSRDQPTPLGAGVRLWLRRVITRLVTECGKCGRMGSDAQDRCRSCEKGIVLFRLIVLL